MDYNSATLKDYLDDLAAKLPAPGGGSAAALNAALGAALITMVVNFTLGKPRYKKFEKALLKIKEISEKLRQEFLNLVDLDVLAYKSKNIRDALDVPFMLCRLSCEGIKLCPALIKKGNLNLISDVAVAVIFLESAFSAGYYNVAINLKIINDKKLNRAIYKELRQKARTVKRIRIKTEEKVGDLIRG